MIEYHGWIVVRTGAPDWGEGVRPDDVARHVDQMPEGPRMVDVRMINGVLMLQIAGAANHRGREVDLVLALFRTLGTLGPGSYGLLHVLDEEDAGASDRFRVWVLRRGIFEEREDPFLSPIVPTIEDDC